MMRVLVFCGWLAWSCGQGLAQTNSTEPPYDPGAAAVAKVPGLYQAWAAERDPAKRSDLAVQLIDTIIHEYDKQETDIADEVTRDGLPKNVLTLDAPAVRITLDRVTVLKDVHADPNIFPRMPVFRRISANRIEAWMPKEGWLFNPKGKLLVDAKVPRRDGTGREWFGAFLPDGLWITTDLWADDKQLNGFSPTGKWLWELDGASILQRLKKTRGAGDEIIRPSIGWARADRTGQNWVISLGTDFDRAFALVDSGGVAEPLSDKISLWSKVYPRSMGPRGYYIALFRDSDDGKVTIDRNEAGHGIEVGWPSYAWDDHTLVVRNGQASFGFWPNSKSIFIERSGGTYLAPHELWFFDSAGEYQAEVEGTYLADAANEKDFLVQGQEQNQVLRLSLGAKGPVVSSGRTFAWPDGTPAVPLAIYDDLRMGFFLRGAGIPGYDDNARRARGTAEVVLAMWKE